MALSTSAYSFTDEEVSQLANCNDQDEFLHFFQRILQSKGIDITAVFDAQTTLGSSTDYGASVLTRFFENGGCKPRHGRGDRKRERSFRGLRAGMERVDVYPI